MSFEYKLKSISALDGLAADACLGADPGNPEAFANYCIRLVSGMVVDNQGNKKWTVEEVEQLPDGIMSEIVDKCQQKREADAEIAKKSKQPRKTIRPRACCSGRRNRRRRNARKN